MGENEGEKMDLEENKEMNWVLLGLIIITSLVMLFNIIQLQSVKGQLSQAIVGASVSGTGSSDSNLRVASGNSVIPSGIPDVYGKELGLSYDDVSPSDQRRADAAISVLGNLDQNIQLSQEQLERYINILYKLENGISCEYCCGARAIIFETGEPACGCAHSYAMRGLTKYLLTQHSDQYTDEQILEEVGKWKTLFFPTQIQQKADILASQGIELNYINLASNKYRGIEQGQTGSGMVGGC